MYGRQWSDGLHQAVEAQGRRADQGRRRRRSPRSRCRTSSSCTRSWCGMTGTAMTEANEFWKIYKLDVVADPDQPADAARQPPGRHLPHREGEVERGRRRDRRSPQDRPADPRRHRLDREERTARRPCSASTASSTSVLNAKYHEREAEIVAQAGRIERRHHRHQHGRPRHRHHPRRQPRDTGLGRTQAARTPRGSMSPSPNGTSTVDEIAEREGMKAEGRKVAELGGLHVIGTERHDARRIDLQLRGRAGRQGDPGSSRFYLSLEDDLMRIFAGEWVTEHAHPARHAGRRGHRKPDGHQADREGPEEGRRTPLRRRARTCSNTTR